MELIGIFLSVLVLIVIVISLFISVFSGNRKESKDDYRVVISELGNIKVDIAKLQVTTDNIQKELVAIREKQTHMDKDIDSIRKDGEHRLQLNLVDSRHQHAHLHASDDTKAIESDNDKPE